MAVHNHAHVMEKGGSSFGHHVDLLLAGRLDHLLSLVATGLIVAFDRTGAKGSRAFYRGTCVFDIVDDGLKVTIRTIQDKPGRIDPWPHQSPAFYHLGEAKHRFRIGRWIVCGCYAIGQVGIKLPVLLYRQSVSKGTDMCMDVDDAGHDGPARHIILLGVTRDSYIIGISDSLDFVLIDDQSPLFNNLIPFHGEDPGVGKGNASLGSVNHGP